MYDYSPTYFEETMMKSHDLVTSLQKKNANTTFLRPFHIPDAIMSFQVTRNLR